MQHKVMPQLALLQSFMRFTVLVSDVLLLFPACFVIIRAVSKYTFLLLPSLVPTMACANSWETAVVVACLHAVRTTTHFN